MTAGRAALVELMHRYLAGLLDPFVTLLEVHKLMYFLQEAGENPCGSGIRKPPMVPIRYCPLDHPERIRQVRARSASQHLFLGRSETSIHPAPDSPCRGCAVEKRLGFKGLDVKSGRTISISASFLSGKGQAAGRSSSLLFHHVWIGIIKNNDIGHLPAGACSGQIDHVFTGCCGWVHGCL